MSRNHRARAAKSWHILPSLYLGDRLVKRAAHTSVPNVHGGGQVSCAAIFVNLRLNCKPRARSHLQRHASRIFGQPIITPSNLKVRRGGHSCPTGFCIPAASFPVFSFISSPRRIPKFDGVVFKVRRVHLAYQSVVFDAPGALPHLRNTLPTRRTFPRSDPQRSAPCPVSFSGSLTVPAASALSLLMIFTRPDVPMLRLVTLLHVRLPPCSTCACHLPFHPAVQIPWKCISPEWILRITFCPNCVPLYLNDGPHDLPTRLSPSSPECCAREASRAWMFVAPFMHHGSRASLFMMSARLCGVPSGFHHFHA